MIHVVVKFLSGMVMVFDGRGEQILAYQGRYEDVKENILADAPSQAKFFHSAFGQGSRGEVPREEW